MVALLYPPSERTLAAASPRLKGMFSEIDDLVHLLCGAVTDIDWTEQLEECLPRWNRLRFAILKEMRAEPKPDPEESGDLPEITAALLDPALGAARYAFGVLTWAVPGVAAAARSPEPLDTKRYQAVLRDVSALELCRFTLISDSQPPKEVAEAAAWEAYSRARAIMGLLAKTEVLASDAPVEVVAERVDRFKALLGRVASGWTDEEQAALGEARFSRNGDLP